MRMIAYMPQLQSPNGGAYTVEIYFVQFRRLEAQDQGVGRFGFSWGPSPWCAGGCLLTVSSRDLPLVSQRPLLIRTRVSLC